MMRFVGVSSPQTKGRSSSQGTLRLCLLSVTIALFTAQGACTTEGHTADCEVGGRGNQEDDGCFTPIGGTCLTHDEFVQDRPNDPDADPPLDPEADWIEYMEKRPLCDFEDE